MIKKIKLILKIVFLFILIVSLIRVFSINSYKSKEKSSDDIIIYIVNGLYIYESIIPTWDNKMGIHKIKGLKPIERFFPKTFNYIKEKNSKSSVLLWLGNADFDKNIEVYIYDYKNDEDIFFEITENHQILKEKNIYTIGFIKKLVEIGFLTLTNVNAMINSILDYTLFRNFNDKKKGFYANYWNG